MIDPTLLWVSAAGMVAAATAVHLSAARSRLVEQLKTREYAVEEQRQVIRDVQDVRNGLVEELARATHDRDQSLILVDEHREALNSLNGEILRLQGEQYELAQRHAESMSRVAELEIYSENAPELESTFHRHFGRRRLNLANGRKEFFRVSIDEVQDLAASLNYQLEFFRDAEAKDFRMSLEIRERVLPSMTDAELAQVIADSALKEEYVDPDEAVEDVE